MCHLGFVQNKSTTDEALNANYISSDESENPITWCGCDCLLEHLRETVAKMVKIEKMVIC